MTERNVRKLFMHVPLDHCGGIELDACVCQSMSEMTIDVFRDFSIWDYDELSLDAGAQLPQLIP